MKNDSLDVILRSVADVPNYCEGDQLKTFTVIYAKIARLLKYDRSVNAYFSSYGMTRDMALESLGDRIDKAQDLECLLQGTAVAKGYVKVLEYALDKAGIECKHIESKEPTWYWNQVRINGKWYNCDITNDRDFIENGLSAPHFLKSNADDKNYENEEAIITDYEVCEESISDKQQEELLKEAFAYIERNPRYKKEVQEPKTIEASEEITKEEKPNFIRRIKAKFSKDKESVKK